VHDSSSATTSGVGREATPRIVSPCTSMDAQRRLHVLHSHLTPVDEYPGESQLQAVDCSSSSVGQEWAQPHGYSVALPERLASNDFNVYRCVRACVRACVCA
jgi:hypothetical protein